MIKEFIKIEFKELFAKALMETSKKFNKDDLFILTEARSEAGLYFSQRIEKALRKIILKYKLSDNTAANYLESVFKDIINRN